MRNKAFSIAEAMITLLIISVALAAMAPMMTKKVKQSVDGGLPYGVIVIWSGSTTQIPSGWILCNGANGTPDLRDKFVVGAGNNYSISTTGGAAVVSLEEKNMPGHTHTKGTMRIQGKIVVKDTDEAFPYAGLPEFSSLFKLTHIIKNEDGYGIGPNFAGTGSAYRGILFDTNFDNSWTGESSAFGKYSTGSDGKVVTETGEAHKNLPLYYALAYIMKTD